MKAGLRLILLLGFLSSACAPTPAPKKTATPTQPSPTDTSNPTQTIPPSVSPVPNKTVTPTDTTPKNNVFLICWDGGQAKMIYDLIDSGTLPNFAKVAAAGVRAEYAQSVDPSLSAAALNSIATGSYPSKTGIVSNSYHNPTDSIYWYRRGFDELLDQAEPVWVTASRTGLTTAAVFFPGGSPAHPGQMADYTVGYGIRDAYSNQLTITLKPVADNWQGEIPNSFNQPFEGDFTIREVAHVYLYVTDSSNDNQMNYDTVVLADGRKIDPDSPRLKVGEWGQMLLNLTDSAGADFLIQEIRSDELPGSVKLYHSGVYHNTAAPRQLLEALNKNFGYFPSGHDYYALEHGWITPEQDIYLVERAALWMAEVAAWINTRYNPDLLFTWQDIFDAAGHSFILKDPRQFNYTPENAERYAGYLAQIAELADRALALMLETIDFEKTTLMMGSDHGMAPIHSQVYVNTILEQAGLLTLDSRNYVVVDESKAVAFASGGSAHIYINLDDHEKDGFVSKDKYPQIQEQIIDLFSGLNDPQNGEPVFQRVVPQDELGGLHLDHINAGDVFVQAFPGYHLNHWRGNDSIFETVDFLGQHGYDSALTEMHAFFVAAGPGVRQKGVISPVRIVDYAPTIASLLGFETVPTVDGQPIQALTP
jgi:predicted AlkP superfamily phosphohydrolase/phosphomutase